MRTCCLLALCLFAGCMPLQACPATRVQSSDSGEGGANAAGRERGYQEDSQGSEPSFEAERALLEESQAALRQFDLEAARAAAAEAVRSLLARPSNERNEAWLLLLYSSGIAAGEAEDPRTAKQSFEAVLETWIRWVPSDHPDLQGARGNLAMSIRALGDLQGARVLQEQALEILLRKLPADDPRLLAAQQNLASTLATIGDLDGARALFAQVLEVRSRTLPPEHLDLQRVRMNLARTLGLLGDLHGARALEEQVLEVLSRTLPPDHPELQMARLSFAGMLKRLGDLQGARVIQEQVLEILSRTRPADDPRLQLARQNFAGTLEKLGDLQGARTLYEQVLEVRSRTLPADHPDLGIARLNLATANKALGDFQRARGLEEQGLEVLSRTLPADHPHLQVARRNFAITLANLGDLQGARALQEQVLEVHARTLPADHPDLQRTRLSLAGTLAAERVAERGREGAMEEDEARERFVSLAWAATTALTRSARLALLSASSREAEEHCANLYDDLGRALCVASGLGVFPSDPDLEREAFLLSETTRGAAQATALLARAVREDERAVELRAALSAASKELARLAQAGEGREEFRAAVSRRDQAARELVDLARELSRGECEEGELDLESLAARISPREAIVAYRRYPRWQLESGATMSNASESLCAFVVRGGGELARVELGAIEPIERAVRTWRDLLEAPSERGVSVEAREDHAHQVRSAGEALRQRVIDPLVPRLEEVDHLVVALDDALHAVAIDALPASARPGTAVTGTEESGEDALFGERFTIEQRLSLSELLFEDRPVRAGSTLLALGGASFNSEPLAPDAEELAALEDARDSGGAVASFLRGGAWERGFEPLTHTGLEARGIAALFEEMFEGEARALVLEKRRASRAALEELAPQARFLHLATHGWFAPESVRSWADRERLDGRPGLEFGLGTLEEVMGASPMVLCGLALTGANLPANAVGRYPGLVTAEELATLDLSNCELAVLSACDTHVGERRAGQGVASLQKALHMAGARSVITSLWKVPDEATRDLMLDFYRRLWVEKKPKHQALWEAKMRLRAARDERGDPRYALRDWAAWVLTGAPD